MGRIFVGRPIFASAGPRKYGSYFCRSRGRRKCAYADENRGPKSSISAFSLVSIPPRFNPAPRRPRRAATRAPPALTAPPASKPGAPSRLAHTPVHTRAAAPPHARTHARRGGPAAPRRARRLHACRAPRRPARPSPRRRLHARRPRHPARPSPRRRPARGALHRVVMASLRRAAEARRTVVGRPARLAPPRSVAKVSQLRRRQPRLASIFATRQV
jgi:hypothetical protein